MRQYKPETIVKKMKPSKFFEFFLQTKGPTGTARASVAEIQKNMKSFFLDLAFGNLVQDKYLQFLQDPRIIGEAIQIAQYKMMECLCIVQSMKSTQYSANPVIANPVFEPTLNKYTVKGETYNIIYNGLMAYWNSPDHNPAYLVGISTKLNNINMRGAKQQLLL